MELKNTKLSSDNNQKVCNKMDPKVDKNLSYNKDNHEGCDKNTDFDDLLNHVGLFGTYQAYLLLMTIPFYFYVVFVYNGQLFLTEVSEEYWCWIPQLQNLSVAERKNIAIPSDVNTNVGYSRCSNYKVNNWTTVLETGLKPDHTWTTEECQNGWGFDKSDIPYPTITSELGWVCDRDSYQATAQSIFFCGSIVGGFLIGNVADRYGRLLALVMSNLLSCVGGVFTTFSTNFTQFAVCRFVVGMGFDNVVTIMYIIVLEYTAPKYRSLMANISYATFYCMAACLIPWIALACGHWKVFSLVTSIPMSLAVLTYFLLPESPRWLLSVGKVDETIEIMKKIGKVNNKTIPQQAIDNFKLCASNQVSEEKVNLLHLMRRPLLLRILLLQAAVMVSASMVFDAIIRMSGKIGYDFAISFTLSSLTECPASVLVILFLDRCGRRWLYFGSMLVCALFCFLGAFVPSGVPTVCCCVLARFFVNLGYSTALQWSVESLPTPARASAVAGIHITAYVANVAAPFVVYLGSILSWLPLVVTGVVAAAGACAGLFLPETSGRPMPQTLDDAELLMKSYKMWALPNRPT